MNLNPFKKLQRFNNALKLSDRKSCQEMLFEYMKFKLTKPDLAEQYLAKYLFRKSVTNPGNYIVTHDMCKRIWYYNDMKYKSMFTNKSVFERFFSSRGINVADSFLYNVNHLFFIQDQMLIIKDIGEFRKLLLEMKESNMWKGDHMIVKMKDGSYGGRNIYKVAYDDVVNQKPFFQEIYRKVINSGYLIQNVIVQHPEMNRISTSSLNTLRIDCFINNRGESKIINTTLRFSCTDSFVDNVSSGGMFAGIDMETGILHGEAFSDFDYHGGAIFLSHPKTGLVFKDFQIPFFRESKDLVLKAALLVPAIRVMGWDVGIGTDGPVLLEGNFFNNFYNLELGQFGFGNNSVFRELLDELDEYYSRDEIDLDDMIKEYPLFI